MSITVSRKYLRTMRSVFRKLASGRAMRQAFVRFTTGPEGLVVHCRADQIAVEHRRPGAQPAAELSIPFATLAELEGSKDEPVILKPADSGAVLAEWIESGVPQQRRAACSPEPDRSRWEIPNSLSALNDGFAAAFVEASKSVSESPTRYALNCVALRGKAAQLAATDGKQLFIAQGFSWPWEDDPLVPATDLFGARELSDAKFQVGRSENHIVLASADWTVWLPIQKESRFPDIDHIIPATQTAVMMVDLAPADAEFLGTTLSRLPGKSEPESPVTFHCNGHVAVRAKDQESGQITELVLGHSTTEGQELAIASNRDYLARAASLGCHRLHGWDPDKPILATGPNRLLFWQPLSSKVRIDPSVDAVRIQAPQTSGSTKPTTSVSDPAKAKTPAMSKPSPINRIFQKEKTAMKTETSPSNGQTPFQPVNRIASTESGLVAVNSANAGPIIQAETLRANLRGALASVNELLVSLKRQRKQSQLFKTTLASLKSLEKVS